MYGFLLAFLILDGLFLSVVILLQSGKGGGLAAMGGGAAATDGVMGGRQATTMLTRATWTSGTLFMVVAFVLSIMSSNARLPDSVIRPDLPQNSAPAPILPGVGGDGGAAPADAGTAPAGGEGIDPAGN